MKIIGDEGDEEVSIKTRDIQPSNKKSIIPIAVSIPLRAMSTFAAIGVSVDKYHNHAILAP